MKKIFNILYSTRLMAVLFLVFATAMAIATFIENDYGTQTAKALIYNAWWFELIMILFVINFFGNIFRYRLYKKEKWFVLLFHLAFLFILIGAGITRYYSYEGMMIIDEGETSSTVLSETTYLNLVVDNTKFQKQNNFPLLLSALGKNKKEFNTTFRPKKTAEEKKVNVKLVDYIPWAEKKMVLDENGTEHLFFVESSTGSRHEHYIKKGTLQNIHNILVGFDTKDKNASLNFYYEDGKLKMQSKHNGNWLRMADQKRGNIVKDSAQFFQYLTLHDINGLQFVIPKPAEKGAIKTLRGKKDKKKNDVILVDITANNQTKQIELQGAAFNTDGVKQFSLGDLNFRAWYGAKKIEIPFGIKLNDFQLEKYPGSESPASYASEITVIDKEDTYDFRIFMNNILNHKGFKFFQSSFDNSKKIEQTHLSVNHDFWGTLLTYIGYSMLYIGLICILFAKNTRFDDLKKSLNKIRKKKLTTLPVLFFLFFFGSSFGQENHNHEHQNQPPQETTTQNATPHESIRITDAQVDSILQANLVDKAHAASFSKLVIQDANGRMKPAHTFASELLRKVAHSNSFKGMTPSQVLISITQNPRFWFDVPVIYLAKKDNKKIREALNLPSTTNYARLSDFFDDKANYKIKKQVETAFKSRIKNKFQTDLIKISNRVDLLYSTIGGGVMRIYPVPNDENNKWVSHPEISEANFKGDHATMLPRLLTTYLQTLNSANKTGDYSKANSVLEGIKNFQRKFGAAVIPSKDKIDLEIAYNKMSIFSNISIAYGLVGVILIFLVIAQIFFNNKTLNYFIKALIAVIIVIFIFHLLGLASRWYISGNAPWSNAYESLIYVAWATMLFGLFLGRNSSLTIASTAFLTAIILAFAHQNWLDPEIANLQPVLNSWWLLVHVSIIVASYGPFSLGMILGIVSLFLMAFTTKNNKKKMELNIKELTLINEMSITVGLVMLSVGNFLGGMWANESWGRYWGWDPKETWALISIMIYAFVLHMRLIPGLRGRFTFNLSSVIAFASIMMTYFGVNFYLSGLHSYASGDKVITPNAVFYSIAFVSILGIFAWLKYKKHYKKG